MDPMISLGQKNTLAEYMIPSGADNRPPMLDKDLYDSWRDNGVIRMKKYAELSVADKIQADCDMKATNIIFQCLLADIYSLMNHHRVSKDLWRSSLLDARREILILMILIVIDLSSSTSVLMAEHFNYGSDVIVRGYQNVLNIRTSDVRKHMTGNRSQLMNFVSKCLGTVRFGNDQIAKIKVQEATAPRAEVLADSLVSTSINQDAPSTSIHSSQEHEHSPIISQGFEESPKTPTFHDDLLNESPSEDSTPQGSSSNVR
ncbi:hypothetical protein Tco_0570749 [Tanacetum coccineum]